MEVRGGERGSNGSRGQWGLGGILMGGAGRFRRIALDSLKGKELGRWMEGVEDGWCFIGWNGGGGEAGSTDSLQRIWW